MWRLIAANLSYKKKLILVQLCVFLALAGAANIILPLFGAVPAPDDDFKIAFFYPIVVVLGALIIGLNLIQNNQREERLTLFAALPRTRFQLAGAHLLVPTIITYGSLAIGLGLMYAVQTGHGLAAVAWRYNFLACFAGFCLVVMQLLLFILELQQIIQKSRVVRFLLFGLIGIAGATQVLFSLRKLFNLELHPKITSILTTWIHVDPESITTVLKIHSCGWLLMILTLVLFLRRGSIEIDHHFSISRLFRKN